LQRGQLFNFQTAMLTKPPVEEVPSEFVPG
jgi:hypothetical protein